MVSPVLNSKALALTSAASIQGTRDSMSVKVLGGNVIRTPVHLRNRKK
jgi:hypothetical protein